MKIDDDTLRAMTSAVTLVAAVVVGFGTGLVVGVMVR